MPFATSPSVDPVEILDLAEGHAWRASIRVHGLAVNLRAGLVDDDDCKRRILKPGFVAKPACKLLAVRDRGCG